MFEAQRQHPVAALTSSLKVVREHIIKIILIYFVGGQQSQSTFFSFTGISILLGVLLLWGFLSWLLFTYQVEDGVLRIEYGIFVRKKLRIPRQRIQVIDVSSGILQRLFGLVSLSVQTAGQSSEETEISAVTREEAERLKELLKVEEEKEESKIHEQGAPDDSRRAYHELSTSRLFTAAVTSGSIGVALSIIGTLLSQVNDLLVETQLYKGVADYFESATGLIVTLVLVILAGGLLLAIIGTLIRYADFSVERKDDELIISRGLFERKQMTIPLNRIQSIRLVEGVLRQPFGMLSIQVDSAGYAQEEGSTTELFPLLKQSEVRPFLNEMLPEFNEQVNAIKPPDRSERRFVVPLLIPSLMLLIVVFYYGIFSYWMLGIVPLAIGWGSLMYRDSAAGRTNDMAFLRFRLLSRTTVLVPRKRIQRLTFEQNPFQARGKVADLKITVASGRTGASFKVRNLESHIDEGWTSWLLSKSKDRLTQEKQTDELPETIRLPAL